MPPILVVLAYSFLSSVLIDGWSFSGGTVDCGLFLFSSFVSIFGGTDLSPSSLRLDCSSGTFFEDAANSASSLLFL